MELAKHLDADHFKKYPDSEYLRDEDIVINSTGGGTLGRIGMFHESDRIGQQIIVPDSHVTIVRSMAQINKNYMYFVLLSYQPYLEKLGEGSTNQTELKPAVIADLFIPIPPLDEQVRIVEKVSDVIPFINEYDTKKRKLDEYNTNFPDQLKKSILQWAIQGKLVQQDPTDEPASVLLERIRAEKERLVKEGKIKKDKNESVIFRRDNSHYEKLNGIERCIDDEIPFEIPDNWSWSRIGSAFALQAGKNISASEIYENQKAEAYPCYGGNGLRGYVNKMNHEGDYPIIGRQGALCGNINRATGKFYATEHAVCVDTFCKTNVSWACIFLTALNLNQYATATAQPGLAVSKINTVLIPIPPLAEQKRIVSMIERLTAVVDTITQ